MDATSKFKLSFYQEIKPINHKKNVFLVSHVETGILYVKKIYSNYNLQVFQKLKELSIPGIPKYELIVEDKDNGTLIVIEEYINGCNLDTYMKLRDMPLSPLKAGEIVARLALTLDKLHKQTPPIIHRDIKPSNVIMDQDDNIYLVDFNISRNVTPDKNQDTAILGTQGYAAPEQYGFMQCTEKSDIYSLGVLLHFLTGKSPKYPQDAKGPLSYIVKKSTAMDPDKRYPSAKEMAYDILDVTHELLNRSNKNSQNKKQHTNGTRQRQSPHSNQTKNPGMNPHADASHNNNGSQKKFLISWQEYKTKIKTPLKMPLPHIIAFLLASIATGYLYYNLAVEDTLSVYDLFASMLTFVIILVFPFLAIYYIRKKKLRICENTLLNIICHFVIIAIIGFLLIISVIIFILILQGLLI